MQSMSKRNMANANVMLLILFLLVMVITLSSCKQNDKDIQTSSYERIQCDHSSSNHIIPDAVTAIKYADVYMTDILENDLSEYILYGVNFDFDGNGNWNVLYLPNTECCGGDITIELSEITGEVISVSLGE